MALERYGQIFNEFIWKVNVNSIKCKFGDGLSSPKFCSIPGSKSFHHLTLYPNGAIEEHKDFVGIYLELVGDKAQIECTISFLNLNENEVYKKTFTSLHDKANPSWGISNILRRSALLDPNQKLLIENNIATIVCRVIVKKLYPSNNKISFDKKQFNFFELLFSNEDNYSDITLNAMGTNYHAHKCILAAQSPVFHAMFKNDMKEKNENLVIIEDVKPEVLKEFLRFIYSGKVEKIKNIVCDLLTIAEKYQVDELKKICGEKMYKYIDEDNATDFLSSVDKNNFILVKEQMIDWISSRLKDNFFLGNPKYKSFITNNPELMYEILQASANNKSSEEK